MHGQRDRCLYYDRLANTKANSESIRICFGNRSTQPRNTAKEVSATSGGTRVRILTRVESTLRDPLCHVSPDELRRVPSGGPSGRRLGTAPSTPRPARTEPCRSARGGPARAFRGPRCQARSGPAAAPASELLALPAAAPPALVPLAGPGQLLGSAKGTPHSPPHRQDELDASPNEAARKELRQISLFDDSGAFGN